MGREFKNVLINRLLDEQIKRCASKYLTGALLDIGCGTKPYERYIRPHVTSYIGVDHPGTLHGDTAIDVWSTAYSIPLPDSHFDSALCTCVLEHLEEPEAAIRECWRILKPGGFAVYEVPFIWHVHEAPRDFFRFSRFGVKYLFEKAGFEVVEIRALTGFWGTFGQLFVYNLYRLNRGPLKWLRIIDVVGLALQFGAYWLDRFDRTEVWASEYTVVVRKI